jgi:hypothetical protein
MENEKIEQIERICRALEWCKKRNIGSKRLNIFDLQYKKKKKEKSEEEFKKKGAKK